MRHLWALSVALAACYGPSVSPGAPCGPNGECPSGLQCIAGTCQPPGTVLDDAPPLDDDAEIDGSMVVADAAIDANPIYVPWGTPIKLDSLELATTGETDPSVSMNRLAAMLVSDSPDEITECARGALTDTFTCATLTAVNSSAEDKSPELSADGSTLYFVSNRAGNFDVYMSSKTGGVWATPALVTQLSTASEDSDLAISPDGLTAVVLSNGSSNRFTLHARASTALPFGAGVAHAELEVTSDIGAPTITNNGNVIYFHAGGTRDLYMATRKPNGTYNSPAPVTELNTSGRDAAPFVSANDKYMIFERDSDIFETSRP
ncbi:MAG TPA: hypothetical protein VIV11_33485 [Kofleriaceae bacterium]